MELIITNVFACVNTFVIYFLGQQNFLWGACRWIEVCVCSIIGRCKKMGGAMKVLALAIGLAAVTTQVFAGWSCTMPNGAIVFRQLSECPADAVHAEQRDSALPNPVKTFKHAPQETLTVGPALPDPPRRAQTPPPVPQSPAAAPPAPPRDLISEANAVCVLLRLKGATTCELEVNIFSASYIDATMPTSAAAAKWVCLGIANQTRQAGSPFVGRGWQLKIFSPYGDGSRPVAVCAL